MNNDPWKHRSAGMTCATCMWFVVKTPDPKGPKEAPNKIGKNLGRCRRHSPTLSGYPGVFEDDWCGDHKLDENKI